MRILCIDKQSIDHTAGLPQQRIEQKTEELKYFTDR